jgi:hypothetical protein
LNHHGVSPLSLARTIANYDVAQFFADLPCDGAAYQAAAADERRARQGLVR